MTDSTIRTEPTDLRPTHTVSFEQGETKIGLILCDGRGTPTGRGLRQGKMPRTSLQIRQGDAEYSDLELPYTPYTLKDFSGGRGLEDSEKDKSRYADSLSVDTLAGDIILGPKPVTAVYDDPPVPQTNDQEDSEHFPNPITDDGGGGDIHYSLVTSNEYIDQVVRATRFQWTNDANASQIKLWMANTNRVRVIIFKYPTVDLSTTAEKLFFANVCYGMYPAGSKIPDYGIEVMTKQDFAIPEASTLTEYTLDLPVELEENAYYMLVVSSLKRISATQAEDFTIPPIFGTNDTAPTVNFYGLKGYFTRRQEGGTTVKPAASSSFFQNTGDSLAYSLIPSLASPGGAFYFNYRDTLFLVTSPLDGSAPRLFMEGYHGYAADNTANPERILARNIGAEADDAIVKVVGGKGSTELTRWRKITSVVTGASGYLVVDRKWNIAHDTTTEFSVMGTGKWKEITGHGLTKAVTDVMVVDNIVYFAMGEDTFIRRMRFVNTGGVWTPEYANETTYASYLKLIQNESGEKKVWRALATAVTAASSDAKAWADNLDFGTAITCGNTLYRITGIQAYGSPRIPWIMKEDGFGAIANDIYDQVPLTEFSTVSDDDNGRASLQRGVYLYLSLLNGLERYYESRLDDIGPNRDKGLPNDRNGKIRHMLAYPGRMYVAIDHPTGYSSVMAYNDIGWHEIYRTSLGARIYAMHVQVIPGDLYDRLWIAHEGAYTYLPIALDPKKQTDYQYNASGELVTAWISGGFKEIKKFLYSIKIFTEGLNEGAQYIRVSYQLDNEEADWVEIDTNIDTSPTQEVLFSATYDVSAQQFRIKLTLYTNDASKTPRVKGITINPVTRLPIKKSWSMVFRLDDSIVDFQGKQSELSADELMTQLEAWADSATTPTPLIMHAPHKLFDNKYVFIEPDSLAPISWEWNKSLSKLVALGQMTVYEA